MAESADHELYQQAVSLLGPGETELVGIVVHTDFSRRNEPAMNALMLEIGERIADTLQDGEMYVYAGEDDERFGAGQFHGRRLRDDAVLWECQQLIRDNTFDLVFYWERAGEQGRIVTAVEDLADSIVPITQDGFVQP